MNWKLHSNVLKTAKPSEAECLIIDIEWQKIYKYHNNFSNDKFNIVWQLDTSSGIYDYLLTTQ